MVGIIFFGLVRVAENYWYSYDGMASEPARPLVLLPSSFSGVIFVVIYVCFTLLRVTNGSELTLEDDKLEPKIDKTSSKKQKPCSSISVESDEEKLKKKPTREDGKACCTDPSDEETLKKNPAKKACLKDPFEFVPRKRFEMVSVQQLWEYKEFDRKYQKNHCKSKNYLKQLSDDIEENDIKEALQLAISKNSQRAYLYEGNHRLRFLRDLGVKYAPVKVTYYFLRDHDDESLNFVPKQVSAFPSEPLPSDFGFIVANR